MIPDYAKDTSATSQSHVSLRIMMIIYSCTFGGNPKSANSLEATSQPGPVKRHGLKTL